MSESTSETTKKDDHQGLIWVLIGLVVILFIALAAIGFLVISDVRAPAPTEDISDDVAIAVTLTVAAEQTRVAPEFTATPPPPTATEVPPTATTVPPTPTPTSTPFSGDPEEILGKPDGKDTFDNDNNWTLFDNDCYKSEIKEGMYWMEAKGLAQMSCWEVTWPEIQNYYYQVLVEMPDKCDPNDRFGLFFRAPDDERGYLFGLTCDGRYSMTYWDGNETGVVVDFATDDAIKDEPGEINRIGVIVDGNHYSLYANGIFLQKAEDDTFLRSGKIGFFVRAATEESFSTRFDDLGVWLLEE
jgi:hypothetical protein